MASKIKLIITADDYGVIKYIDDGIIEGIKAGIINTVTVVVNFNHNNYCRKSLNTLVKVLKDKDLLDKVGIGLHLNITMGKPLSVPKDIPTLVNSKNNFYTQRTYFADPGRFDFGEIRDEANLQMATFIDHLQKIAGEHGIPKIPIDHVTSHFNFFHVVPEMVDILTEICETFKKYGKKPRLPIPVRRPLPTFIEYEDLKNALPTADQSKKVALQKTLQEKLEDIKTDTNNYAFWHNLSFAGLGYMFTFLERKSLLPLIDQKFKPKKVRVAHGLFICFYATRRQFTLKVHGFKNILDDLYEAAVMTGVIADGEHFYLEVVHHLGKSITKKQKRNIKISGFDKKYLMKFRPKELEIVKEPDYAKILATPGISHGLFSDMKAP